MIDQISVYMENKRGATRTILTILSERQINVLGFVNNDSAEFGTIRLIVSDPEEAFDLLREKGFLVLRSHVIGIELPDSPGALETMLSIIENMNINVDYMYVGYMRENRVPVILLHCEEMEIVSAALRKQGYRIY